MLTDKETEQLRKELSECQRPLYYFHDDPDGLASFIMCQHIKGGAGVPVKAHPHLTTMFLRKIEELQPDKVFVLDIAQVDQEFIDGCKVPVVWVDHHDVQQRERVTYFNPRIRGENVPTPMLLWPLRASDADLWVATVGCIGDWYWPPFAAEFSKQYPDLLPSKVKNVDDALFDTPLSTLVKVFSFVLKGRTGEVNKAVRILTRLASPYEVLKQETPAGKHVWQMYDFINKSYQQMLDKAIATIDDREQTIVYTYVDDKLSLTKDLANELLYRYRKVIVLGRERLGEVRCSLRSPPGVNIKAALEKALVGVEGYGGGHENACGAAVKKEDFKRFIDNLKRELAQ
jgi:single-stranded DNA-specific DHH superfamily exonuclease